MNMPDADFLFEFKKFLNQHVDCRLEAMLTEDDRTANHEDRTAELEAKVEELEWRIKYYSDHEDRISELEDTAAAIAAPPECETHREFRKRSEYLRQNDETCCTAIDSAVSDPSKKSETTPTSETGTKPTNACHKRERARNQLEQSMRAHGKNHDLSDLIDAELLPQYKKYSEDELMAIREDAEKFWEHPQ